MRVTKVTRDDVVVKCFVVIKEIKEKLKAQVTRNGLLFSSQRVKTEERDIKILEIVLKYQ
jgi:hypothetical protein